MTTHDIDVRRNGRRPLCSAWRHCAFQGKAFGLTSGSCIMQDLADKIASLNSAIDDVSAQLKAQDNSAEMAMTSNATPQ